MTGISMYPPVEPYNSGFFEVSSIHKVYFEECGTPTGTPLLFIYGGPGSGLAETDRQYFDPTAYRIILFDRRGCGKSTPAFCTEDNTTWKLLEDIEQLREHFGINRWIICGCSWGSFLAQLYTQKHIERVLALILQGVLTFREDEGQWLYRNGASFLFPDYWEEYVAPIPESERGNVLAAHLKRMTGDDKTAAEQSARAIAIWDACNTRLRVNEEKVNAIRHANPAMILKAMTVFCHIVRNKGFLTNPNQVWEDREILKE